ncbi:restriction endonuclease subunit S, partial [Peptacetobacter hiranonis]|uniref:restriction endonuclease subunit S n=1 Tax=Peptacetobacter hiranonis TaxID=89152 RepID=UPI003AB92015
MLYILCTFKIKHTLKLYHFIYFFATTWEQHKLGDLANIVGGGTPSTNMDKYWDGNINWFSPIEVGNQIYKIS